MKQRWLGLVLLTGTLVLQAGCARRVNVTGSVTEKGTPIAGAELRWVSEGEEQTFSNGYCDEKGVYVLVTQGKKGIPPGKYQVTVNWWRTRAGKPLPAGEEGAALKDPLKAKQFTASFEQEISPETTTVDFEVADRARVVSPN